MNDRFTALLANISANNIRLVSRTGFASDAGPLLFIVDLSPVVLTAPLYPLLRSILSVFPLATAFGLVWLAVILVL